MSDKPSARTFISYSRKDGAEFAADLRNWLVKENFSVWQDLIALEGGRDWWSQIEDALKSTSLQHFVLVVTPAALASPVVRREIRLARQEGKTVSPIKGPGLGDLGKLPRWIGQVYDLDLPEYRTTLIRVLQNQSRQKRVVMMAPEPPADFVERPTEFDALKRSLLDGRGNAVTITAALRGAGGYGKTTLAKSLAHDPEIQDAYFDGILWVELGERTENLLAIVSDLITRLTGSLPGLETINAAASALGEALGDRQILLIVDDVWHERDLRPFLQGGPNTTRLVTTRIDSVLPIGAVRQPVDAMQLNEALKLLGGGLPVAPVADLHLELGKLAQRLGEWALLLKLVNGFLRDRVVKSRQPLAQALVAANTRLDKKGLAAFDPRNEPERTKAVALTIGVSLELLDPVQQGAFGVLGIFSGRDADIPIGILARLWHETSEFDESDTEALLSELYDLSLLLTLDFGRRIVQLHDVIRDFLQEQAGPEALAIHHKKLLRAIDEIGASDDVDCPTRRYYYLYLPDHLAEARERERLDALLLDVRWLQAKLAVTRDPQAIVGDYDRHAAGVVQSLVGRTLRLTAGIFVRDPRQLVPQLLGRLMAFDNLAVTAFLNGARLLVPRPAMLTQRPSLTPPGAEIGRLQGHSDWVTALCVLSDGRLASGSGDKTIRLWDVNTGAELACLEGHSHSVDTLCLLPDGRLASSSADKFIHPSGSGDNTIRLWDLADRVESASLQGHSDWVTALCVLSDGRLASGSDDKTVRLWDLAAGAESARFEGHTNGVTALCALPDGRLASGSRDRTIRLWDLIAGTETTCLKGHTDAVTALCVLSDGRLASSSWDNTIRLWDLATGAEPVCLREHTRGVTALCVSDGRLASGSWDQTIRLWDLIVSAEISLFKALEVTALCALADGRLVSGSWDRTIRLWDSTSIAVRLQGHTNAIASLCLLPGGRVASGSWDNTIRLWNLTSGAEIARLEGHTGAIDSLCALPDGRLASSSYDKTVRLWDLTLGKETTRLNEQAGHVSVFCVLPDGRLASGSWGNNAIRLWDVTTCTEITRLEGHAYPVTALCLLPDGHLASGSQDKTIRIWDLTTSVELCRLSGHTKSVAALCVLPDGQLASSSWDQTLRLWDLTTGSETAQLEGHTDGVTALCVLPNGRLVSSSRDKTVRLWDGVAGQESTRLEVDAPIDCLIALPQSCLVAGDACGQLHWLEIVD
jgi:WD40 repeat protein